MFEPDKSQLNALKTWYALDNPLHSDPTHPAIKLAGEAGEILDLYGKDRYKPNFSWWKCKKCGVWYEYDFDDIYQEITNDKSCDCNSYTPLVLDELGDFSYYLRILAYQQQTTFEYLIQASNPPDSAELPRLLADLNLRAAFILSIYLMNNKTIFYDDLVHITGVFLAILKKLDCPLERLIELNYQKLNGQNDNNHGWKDAR